MSDSGNDYYSACDACRSRKFKCTKERPACAPCLQLSIVCHYSRKVSRTPLTRNNLTAAEDRVCELENAFASLFPGTDLDTVLSSSRSGNLVNPARNTATLSAKKPPTEELKEQENRDASPALESLPREADGFDWAENAVRLSELSDGMAALSINPEGAGYLGATSSVVPLRALFSKEQNATASLGDSAGWHSQSLLSQQMPLVVPENTFVNAYFTYYHSTYPFLYEPLFRSQFEGKSPRPEGSWPLLFNVVLALGAWCMGEDESAMDDYFDERVARLSEQRSIFESGNLTLVQALLLLSNYTQKRNRPNTGWNYLGLAVRMALSLGLHKEFPNWEISLLQREMRRRVWWGLFIFDSGASITFGRPVLLPQHGIMDASQVLNIEEESLIAQTTSLPREVSHTTIYTPLICQSSFHSTTNDLHHRLISIPGPSPQELIVLNQTIDAWETTLPSYFQLDEPSIQLNDTFLFARYRLSWRSWNLKILLSRPVVLQWAARKRNSDGSSSAETSEEVECRNICIQSASATINSISEFVSKGIVSRLSTWYMLYFLFQAGLVPIICLTCDSNHKDSPMWLADILTTKDLLSRTAITNRLAARCLAVFNRLSPLFDSGMPEDLDLGSWEGTLAAGFSDDQFGEGFWDWANNEMNWSM